jgi:hypothetical protein
MESLALIVTILFVIGILSAPVSMLLTRTHDRWMHVVAAVIASIGTLVGVQFLIADVAIGARLIGFSITFFNVWAIARVAKRWDETKKQ